MWPENPMAVMKPSFHSKTSVVHVFSFKSLRFLGVYVPTLVQTILDRQSQNKMNIKVSSFKMEYFRYGTIRYKNCLKD